MTYDPAKNSADSYREAIAAKRAKLLMERIPTAKRVDVIGDCELILGDCLEVMPHLEKVDAVVTDPPYGVNIGNHASATDMRSGVLAKGSYASYEDTLENLIETVVPAIEKASELTERMLVFVAGSNIKHFPCPKAVGGVYIPAAVGRNAWGYTNYWPCLLYGSAPDLHKGAYPTVIRSVETAEKNGHPTPKPIGWMKWAVTLASRSGETILDPFMGSGTTGVACAKLGRRFIGIELDEGYFNIACDRIRKAYAQPDLFVEQTKKAPEPKQEDLDL